MTEELQDKYANFHDGIIVKHLIDFKNKKTEITIKMSCYEDNVEFKIYRLEFENVELQNFDSFNDCNIIYEIGECRNCTAIEYSRSNYLYERKDYINEKVLEKIKQNEFLKFYYIESTVGLQGIIVCKSLIISQVEY